MADDISDRARELLPCPFCGGCNVKTFGPYGWNRQWGISHSCGSFYSGTSKMFQGFPSKIDAIAAWNIRPPVEAGVREALERIEARTEKGRAAVLELQAAMDGHYTVIREYLGAERGPGFAHRVNSLLLRISGHFVQIRENLAALTPPSPNVEEIVGGILRYIAQVYGHRPDVLFDADNDDNIAALTEAVRFALARNPPRSIPINQAGG